MIKFITTSLLTILLIACNNTKKQNSLEQSENVKAKELMQGIWIDDESDIPLLFIKGDTIYYANSQSTPVYFKIIKDTLYTFGNELARYQIDKQTEYSFSFHSLADNIVKLHKSEDPNDSLAFSGKPVEIIPIYTEVTQKDSVVFYNGIRYRAYVYINPSKIKVIKTTYSEEGISMDNIYYDNIMHICIYEGRKCLFSSDITKQMLENVISTDFLQQSILSEMNFKNVDRKGFHYQATVCIPESSVCNIADLSVSSDGKLTIYTAK